MHWFLYDKGLRQERVKKQVVTLPQRKDLSQALQKSKMRHALIFGAIMFL